ncbi:MAG: winged helix-turn-helix domain-containing protein [Halobacteriales archaeon]
MAIDGGDSGATTFSPDTAFTVLGNETRIGILQTLGEADDPMSFSELREQVGMADSGQFNYHLDKLVDHFVQKDENGYRLTPAGRRIIKAVLSGAIDESPVLELTEIDQSCHYCGASIEIGFQSDQVIKYCTECEGKHGDPIVPENEEVLAESGFLGALPMPPAGIQGRTAEEVYEAAWTWANLDFLAEASGICPECSARLDRSVSVCEEHATDNGLCDSCGGRHAVKFHAACTNCIHEMPRGPAVMGLVSNTDLLAFLADHDLNPVSPESDAIVDVDQVHMGYDEEVLSTDPFRARFTFRIDDDTLTLTVGAGLTVLETARG